MTLCDHSRRSFLKTSVLLSGAAPLLTRTLQAQPGDAGKPLIAYVGTFSSPLRDMLATQVDLPPGNGRGIHIFNVDRATGAMTPIEDPGTWLQRTPFSAVGGKENYGFPNRIWQQRLNDLARSPQPG